jgi:hypothetical protein
MLESPDKLMILADAQRKKRLGQYFSGMPLAKLLASLANAQHARSIIDPMSGDGDMLDACLQIGATPQHLVGIEIDREAYEHSLGRLRRQRRGLQLVLGNAFSPQVIRALPVLMYDLVITNPPYVRYQSLSHGSHGEFTFPDAKDVRQGLAEIVDCVPSLDSEDRRLLLRLIESYSGLSDLAVPSWLLCAMLTRVGGTLAMVVPDAWLSRDYALTIQYLLLRWFRIIYVVEDSNASWFSNALVKTTLIVAERINRRDSAFSWHDERFLLASLSSESMNDNSVVGGLFPVSSTPERDFAELLSTQKAKGRNKPGRFLSLQSIQLKHEAETLRRRSVHSKWLTQLESGSPSPKSGHSTHDRGDHLGLHSVLLEWLGTESFASFTSPIALGINISQGLRTGANQFFYAELLHQDTHTLTIAPDPVFNLDSIHLPASCAVPVLRKQTELPSGYRLDTRALRGRALVLQNYALPEDLGTDAATSKPGSFPLVPMPNELARLVRVAARTNVSMTTTPKYIPEMSAVKTNVRKPTQNAHQSPPRFWYMLPEFTPRHRPDLFVARVNSAHPKIHLNAKPGVLIDANFSTLWLSDTSPMSTFAALALLNSTWCVTAMELTGTVMGGGALKLEATHLRRLPIPILTAAQWAQLDTFGRELAEGLRPARVIAKIDRLIVEVIHQGMNIVPKMKALERINREQLRHRSQRS